MYVCIVIQRIRRAASTGAARSLPKNPKVNLAHRWPRNVYITRVSTSRVHVYTYITYLRLDLHICIYIYFIYIRVYSTCVTCRRPPIQIGFSRSRCWSCCRCFLRLPVSWPLARLFRATTTGSFARSALMKIQWLVVI